MKLPICGYQCRHAGQRPDDWARCMLEAWIPAAHHSEDTMSGAVKAGDVLAPWFLRGDLPERIALMVDYPGAPRGTVFDWVPERKGYKARGADLWLIPEVVRRAWLHDFCWAPTEQEQLAI